MHNDPDHIKHEIDAIQLRMKQRAEALGEQLSPSRIVTDSVSDLMRDPGETVSRLADTVRNHPFASAMVAAGVASLAGTASRDRVAAAYANSDYPEKIRQTARRGKARAQTVAKSSREGLDSVSETVSEAAENATSKAHKAATTVSGKVHDASEQGLQRSRDLATDARRFAQDNPVALGLFALGAGALAASFFTARSASHEDTETARKKSPAAKPKTTQAKKATRAKSSPNKTVKRMAPAGKTAPATDKTKTRAAAKGSGNKRTSTRKAASTAKSAAKSATGTKKTTGNGKDAVLSELNESSRN